MLTDRQWIKVLFVQKTTFFLQTDVFKEPFHLLTSFIWTFSLNSFSLIYRTWLMTNSEFWILKKFNLAETITLKMWLFWAQCVTKPKCMSNVSPSDSEMWCQSVKSATSGIIHNEPVRLTADTAHVDKVQLQLQVYTKVFQPISMHSVQNV